MSGRGPEREGYYWERDLKPIPGRPRRLTPLETIMVNTDLRDMGHSTPCWVWTGMLNHRGYGHLKRAGLSTHVHRACYTLIVGSVPEGLALDHLCRVKSCCNPRHLEPVTSAENTRRAAPYHRRTHCKHGHMFTLENTFVREGGERVCRICRRANKKAWKRRHRHRAASPTSAGAMA